METVGSKTLTRVRLAQSFILIWVDSTANEADPNIKKILKIIYQAVNLVKIYQDPNLCYGFLKTLTEEKVFLIVAGPLTQTLIPRVHPLIVVDKIFVFCGAKTKYEALTKTWPKIKIVSTKIHDICVSVKNVVNQCIQNLIGMSFTKPQTDAHDNCLNRLEPSFMYTELFKKIIINMKHGSRTRDYFVQFARNKYADNPTELNIIEEFERDYRNENAIWWYTRECFIYHMMNRALRLLEADIIVNMGFFIHDLHKNIEKLCRTQASFYRGKRFKVFRGQGLSKTDHEKLMNIQGGLLGFNSFLSTSIQRDTSFAFAQVAARMENTVGILFIMNIDPKLASTPFAKVNGVSYFPRENEIIFSMHTIFRVDKIEPVESCSNLFTVYLSSTAEVDKELHHLTQAIEREFNSKGWDPLAKMLIKVDQIDKAEELYQALLGHEVDIYDKAHYNHQLGVIHYQKGNYTKAIEYHNIGIQIYKEVLPEYHIDLATAFSNLGLVYDRLGEYEMALNHYKEALHIQNNIDANNLDLAVTYNNIGMAYDNLGEYALALEYYKKSLDIQRNAFQENHPEVARLYSNIGLVCNHLGEYEEGIKNCTAAIAIQNRTLPQDHLDLGTSHNNLGLLLDNMRQYPNALSNYERAISIFLKKLQPNHLTLATSYNNIGLLYKKMTSYNKAIQYYEKGLEIEMKVLRPDHPNLGTSYNNLAWMYRSICDYRKSLTYFNKALPILEKTLSQHDVNVRKVHDSIRFLRKQIRP